MYHTEVAVIPAA